MLHHNGENFWNLEQPWICCVCKLKHSKIVWKYTKSQNTFIYFFFVWKNEEMNKKKHRLNRMHCKLCQCVNAIWDGDHKKQFSTNIQFFHLCDAYKKSTAVWRTRILVLFIYFYFIARSLISSNEFFPLINHWCHVAKKELLSISKSKVLSRFWRKIF